MNEQNNSTGILVVDDDLLNLMTLAEIFQLRGFQVDTANSGKEALEKINRNLYQCILSDISMPEMNGVELLRQVKTNLPYIPFILMTAYTDDMLIVQGIKEGALVTLTKPLDIDGLIAHISLLIV